MRIFSNFKSPCIILFSSINLKVLFNWIKRSFISSRLKLSYAVRTQDKKNSDAVDVNNTEAEKKLFSKNKNKTGKKNG